MTFPFSANLEGLEISLDIGGVTGVITLINQKDLKWLANHFEVIYKSSI